VDLGLVGIAGTALAAIGLLGWAIARVSRRAQEMHGREMSLLDHLRELRFRALASLGAIAAASVALFSFDVRPVTLWGYDLWAPVPTVMDSLASRGLDWILHHVLPPNVDVVVIQPTEAIMAQFQASLVGALAIASPFIAYQVAAFLAPALHPDERRAVGTGLPIALLLFLAGMAFAMWLMVPLTLQTLYQYAEPIGASPLAQPQEIVTFVLFTTLLFGIAFETPLVMAGLSRSGVMSPATMGKHWRGVVVGVLVLGSVLTDPNPVTQLLVSVPLVLLYFIGLGLAKLVWREPGIGTIRKPSQGSGG
jgi:sec-independent protein translocase protein TatC